MQLNSKLSVFLNFEYFLIYILKSKGIKFVNSYLLTEFFL